MMPTSLITHDGRPTPAGLRVLRSAELKDKIAAKQQDIDTVNLILKNCDDDESYRIHSRRLVAHIQQKVTLEKELGALDQPNKEAK